jgi:hypothetical protein
MIKSTTSLVLFCLLFAGCAKEKFSSESNWLAPLIETKLTLGDLIPDSMRRVGADQSLSVVYQETFGIASLDEIIEVPDRVETMEVTLSSLVLEDRSFIDTLTLQEIYPASVFLNGQKADLPAQDVQTNQGTKLDVSKEFFSTATFVQGWIDISISNDLPVTAELMEFELLNDDGTNTVVVSGTFIDLAPNTTQTQSYTLAGKTVKGKLELRVKRVKTKASDEPVLIDIKKGLRITFGVRGLKPQSATAVFPAQNLVERYDETKYTFGGAELTRLEVKSGYVLIKVESSIEEALVLNYLVPLSNKGSSNEKISKEWIIPPAPKGETVFLEEKVPIDGFNIYLVGKSQYSEPFSNHVYNIFVAKIDSSGIERTLSLDDKIKIEFGLVDIIPKEIYGDPGKHVFNTKDTLNLDVLKNLSGSLSLEDATLDIDLLNSFGVDFSIDINELKGTNKATAQSVVLGGSSALQSTILLPKVSNATPRKAVEKHIKVDKTNSNLKQFLENLPSTIVPDITAVVRPNGTIDLTDFAYDDSEVRADITINVPLMFGLKDLTISTTDATTLFVNERIDQIKEAKLGLLIENNFPISGQLNLEFLDNNGTVLASAFDDANNIMAAAEVNEATGKTEGSVKSELSISLTREEMTTIQNASNVRVNVVFNTKEAKRYKMFTDYSVDVKVVANITYENKF